MHFIKFIILSFFTVSALSVLLISCSSDTNDMAESQDGQLPAGESPPAGMEIEKIQVGATRASPEPERGEDRRRARKNMVKEEEEGLEASAQAGGGGKGRGSSHARETAADGGGGGGQGATIGEAAVIRQSGDSTPTDEDFEIVKAPKEMNKELAAIRRELDREKIVEKTSRMISTETLREYHSSECEHQGD